MYDGFKYAGIASPVIVRCVVFERDTTTMECVRRISRLRKQRGQAASVRPQALPTSIVAQVHGEKRFRPVRGRWRFLKPVMQFR
jgi:hypothetical protein